MYSFFNVIIASSFLNIIKDKDAFSSCPAKIATLFITFLVSTFSPAKAVDRFFIVLSAFAKSLA
jgi:hypothetical protein